MLKSMAHTHRYIVHSSEFTVDYTDGRCAATYPAIPLSELNVQFLEIYTICTTRSGHASGNHITSIAPCNTCTQHKYASRNTCRPLTTHCISVLNQLIYRVTTTFTRIDMYSLSTSSLVQLQTEDSLLARSASLGALSTYMARCDWLLAITRYIMQEMTIYGQQHPLLAPNSLYKRAPNANYIHIHAIQYSIGLINQYIYNIIVLTTLMGDAIHCATVRQYKTLTNRLFRPISTTYSNEGIHNCVEGYVYHYNSQYQYKTHIWVDEQRR